jgi:hypothetical protein
VWLKSTESNYTTPLDKGCTEAEVYITTVCTTAVDTTGSSSFSVHLLHE